jgi:anti-sigma factor ChrR (cupin superfamily)
MNHSTLPCSDDGVRHDSAERYAMGGMSRAEAARYEEHLLLCPQCQEALAQFDAFLAAMRGAVDGCESESTGHAASASC